MRKLRESSHFKLFCKFNSCQDHNNCGLLEWNILYIPQVKFRCKNVVVHTVLQSECVCGGDLRSIHPLAHSLLLGITDTQVVHVKYQESEFGNKCGR